MKRYTLLIIIALTSVMSHAQITIGGDVYGGGKEGAVNIGNTTATSVTAKESVTLTNATSDATSVTITEEAVVRTVFGGGRNGRCYGQTNVSVDGGKIGATKWTNTIHGGVFGAGDGASAYVFGKENSVLIQGGTIVNNIYGGGNQADLMGCTKVTLQNGHYYGSVFGGARMANIYGHAFTLLDGQNGPDGPDESGKIAAGDSAMVIPAVYGGNDISGTIALSDKWEWTKAENIDISTIPIALRKSTVYNQNPTITNEWNAFVCSTYPLEDDGTTPDYDNNNIFVGNLYGAGNGDYTYTDGKVTLIDIPHEDATYYTAEEAKTYNAALTGAVSTSDTNPSTSTYYTAEEAATYNASLTGAVKEGDIKSAEIAEVDATYENLSKPDLGKTYLNLMGGTYGYVYGGGNNATVTGSTDILVWDMHIDTNSKPYMASIPYSRVAGMDVLESMFDINEGKTTATPKYQIDRLFGGNNKATMAISPEWYLAQGAFNNIYSGGNKGDMIAEDGLLLNIGSRSVYANNVYGGCRMADVRPQYQSGLDVGSDVKHINDDTRECLKVEYDSEGKYTDLAYSEYKFKENCPARVYITEGHINNVYGGNDISGKVYLGTNVVIAGAISGNVYGGGNGSYAYTDNAELAKDPEYADYYYDGGADAASSIAALNAYRPHVENTVLNIFGNSDQQPTINADGSITTKANNAKPVIVTGGVYCGGNSATIESTSGTPSATFKIGKNVIINAVYLGSNGENMITEDILKTHAGSVTVGGNSYDYSKFNLTDKSTFATYMEGCAVNIKPTVSYDWSDGDDPHTFIGSLYGGGNVGSVTYGGPITIDMPAGLVIYDRVVGGCRAADVDKSTYNAAFEGGVITANTGANASVPKVTINMSSYLEPRELWPTIKNGFLETALLYWDVRNYYGQEYDAAAGTYADTKSSVFVDDAGNEVSYASVPWLPYGANVFGGCYTSGHIAGDVQINVTRDLVSNTMIHHDAAMTDDVSTPSNASINWVHLGEYVFAKTMSIYGGGYGVKTYIAGDTHINLSNAARVINVLGGADYGTVGCAAKYDEDNNLLHAAHTGSTHVTVATGMTDYSKIDTGNGVDIQDTHLPYNVTKIYGGAYAGTIYGHTELRLNGGSYQQAYAGSCNADIADYTSLYLGTTGTANSGYPYVYLYAFGGNDFGGYIGRNGKDKTKTDLLVKDMGFADNDILGYHDFTGTQAGYNSKTIRTTRYVEYNSGRVGYQYDSSKGAFDEGTGTGNFLSEAGSLRSSIYGGSYGSYDYSLKYASWDYVKERMTSATAGTIVSYDFDPADASDESKFHYPLMKEYIPTSSDVFCTNTYVNVPCASTDASNNVIQRGIFGGGRGIMEQTGIVDAAQTYVYLHGATWGSRNANLSTDVFGGGYYSIVDNTKVDAESGCTNIIYGGSYGTSAKNLNTDALKDIHYNSTRTEVNMYDGMDNSNMSIFGGGGFAGATDTYVNLYGGKAKNVYGGSYNEGYCETTHVDVPDATNTVTGKASSASVNAIFGGGYGNDVSLPCDENYTNVTFSSSTAYVADVIYGGNNAKRAAVHTNVEINAPVKKSETGSYVNICGAGNGSCSIAGFTNVTLNNGAIVNNVYGGGRDGKVFGYYKNLKADEAETATTPAVVGARLYYDEVYNDDPASSTKRHGYAAWKYDSAYSDDSWEGKSLYEQVSLTAGTDLFGYYTKNSDDTYSCCHVGETATASGTYYKKLSSTTIIVNQGATAQNVYGGGYGSDATVAGSTRAHNHGGTIVGNLFGGGEKGNVVYQQIEETATDPETGDEVTLVKKENNSTQATLNTAQIGNIYTYVCNHGGSVNSIYGGGLDGQVGSYHYGVSYSYKDADGNDATFLGNTYTADTRVEIGEEQDVDNYYSGCPIVLRSVYGGGYRGAVLGTAKIQMQNGYIGYNFTPSTVTSDALLGKGTYSENLKATTDDTHDLLKESGNIFGGGYGEGATTDNTIVNMYGGTIRNSLYGGGEIASIGVADNNSIKTNDRAHIPNIEVAGSTEVNLYGGLVSSNVFGGGRGYAIDAYGNTQSGEKGYSDGYTFGKTNVNIYRGTIGTDATLENGDGNVFGGGNVGYVYGADKNITNTAGYRNVTKHIGTNEDQYYHLDNGSTQGLMSEDCKVVITPACKALTAGTVNGHSYYKGDIIPCTVLNGNTAWTSDVLGDLDKQGVIIRNAVFAGGNVSAGSDKVYANTKTVYGNATASVIDCLQKDLITLGDDDIGGLYGDGNLTFVDGYRELNITNFGTDYYSLGNQLTIEQYNKLSARERSYFELKYVCTTAYSTDTYDQNADGTGGTTKSYNVNDKITGSEYDKIGDTNKSNYFTLAGFCTLYAGRMMNTIQRADFCGVYGSRMVLKGAQDRVPSEVDYTKYTINRIGELSLNKVNHRYTSINSGVNGNYFGIYSVVNYLGALTSDVNLTDTRVTDSETYPADSIYPTYFSYKQHNLKNRNRNNGTSLNKISLASGVWLEIVKQLATSTDDTDVYGNYTGKYKVGDKIYGPITGIVELDIINAATGEGGGYVYALNEHGTRSASNKVQTTLTSSNAANASEGKAAAVSYKQYSYGEMSSSSDMETTGNFVNGTKRIVDDCYPNNGKWLSTVTPTSTAHYWFVRGDYYVYDQYISAYTGAAQSYAESVNVPLTITAEAQGKLKLLNVQQNLNAYWTGTQYSNLDSQYKISGDTTCIVINGNTYYKNTPITYWDWAHLTDTERAFFTTNTYVCNVAVGRYTKGQVLTATDYATAIASVKDTNGDSEYLVESTFTVGETTYAKGTLITKAVYDGLTTQKSNCRLATSCFNVTNAVTTENGFLLTYDWNNPMKWDDYYIKPDSQSNADMIMKSNKEGNSAYNSYILSPTYKCLDAGTTELLGQSSYSAGDIVDASTYDAEPENASTYAAGVTQATFAQAYVAKGDCQITVTEGETSHTYNYVKGSAISSTFWGTLSSTQKENFEVGYICTQPYKVSDTKYYVSGDIITATELTAIPAADRTTNFSLAYYCTSGGAWGGKLYSGGQNYAALDYCSLSATERTHFQYNLDAFETLIANSTTQSYSDVTAYAPSTTYSTLPNYTTRHTNLYAAQTPIDYTAVYNGGTTGTETITLNKAVTVNGSSKTSLSKGDEISREDFETNLVNELANYSAINVYGNETGDYYIVNSEFWVGDTWYSVGKKLTQEEYTSLQSSYGSSITTITGTTLRSGLGSQSSDHAVYYFCNNQYKAVTGVTDINNTTHATGTDVTKGTVISSSAYSALVNEQKDFDITGTVPTETSTLYVSRATDINDLNEDKIVTVIYEYSYLEPNSDGTAYENVKERHIINIHVQFESGVPTVGELLTPPAVLPGDVVGLNQPSVSKGAYEILGGGWEIYTNDQDAQTHKNGAEYTNNNTKMYWYQNGYQVAYYAKSYLGKTYSNSVPITVANYHRMEEVMSSTHTVTDDAGTTSPVNDYMYLDDAVKARKRNPKVYIKDAAELKHLADFFNQTKANSSLADVRNCYNIDFILDDDVDYSGKTWTSLGDAENCFSGSFHGDGHTIAGLSSSLFGHLCGNIYNTGVAGSFTGSGIADYADGNKAVNCWTATTGNVSAEAYPIFGSVTNNATVINSYYYDQNTYKSTDIPSKWTVSPKSLSAFVDGEVAFNLNSYYLGKRYYDGKNTASGTSYQYWPIETIGTTTPTLATAYYPTDYDNYVETRYGNEDFIYADGTIPVTDNIRKKLTSYYPVYPDDYIYFGQKLTYGGVISGTDADSHVEHPEAVKRVTNALDEALNTKLLDTDLKTANRVYRSPAYYKKKVMSTAYFNKPAAFKDSYTLSTGNIYGSTSAETVYKDLTAIDFTGYNDFLGQSSYTLGTSQEAFYKPLLDYDGITDFATSGITRNLLVYDDPTNDVASYAVLAKALPEATLKVNASKDEDPAGVGYNEVATATDGAKVMGHLVNLTKGSKTGVLGTSNRDHFLVDKEVFNCPISYKFDTNYYMWYQRTPANYVDALKGWEAISLPFTADLVSTQDKGEITHFYSNGSTYTKGYDSGHEYWLRKYTGIAKTETNAEGKNIAYSSFAYPTADKNAGEKVDANVFLWDNYYSHDDNSADAVDKDANGDSYPSTDASTYLYYKDSRTYPNYPLYTVAVPYIVGFPGSRYYEFDMSGSFIAQNRSSIDKLDAQVISFVSTDGATIGVSDDELAVVENGGYSYVPNYMNNTLTANDHYLLNTTGSAFDVLTAATAAVPFRPYFEKNANPAKNGTRSVDADGCDAIYITSVDFNKGIEDSEELTGELNIYAKKGVIVVESGMSKDTFVTIHTVGGALLKAFYIAPGEKKETSVPENVIYLVNKKKVFVK